VKVRVHKLLTHVAVRSLAAYFQFAWGSTTARTYPNGISNGNWPCKSGQAHFALCRGSKALKTASSSTPWCIIAPPSTCHPASETPRRSGRCCKNLGCGALASTSKSCGVVGGNGGLAIAELATRKHAVWPLKAGCRPGEGDARQRRDRPPSPPAPRRGCLARPKTSTPKGRSSSGCPHRAAVRGKMKGPRACRPTRAIRGGATQRPRTGSPRRPPR
jgi:hypothetical protein